MTSAHDRWLAAYSRTPVEVTCPACETLFFATCESEYGASWITPEECPNCGNGDGLVIEDTDPADWDPRNEYDPERDR